MVAISRSWGYFVPLYLSVNIGQPQIKKGIDGEGVLFGGQPLAQFGATLMCFGFPHLPANVGREIDGMGKGNADALPLFDIPDAKARHPQPYLEIGGPLALRAYSVTGFRYSGIAGATKDSAIVRHTPPPLIVWGIVSLSWGGCQAPCHHAA